MSASLELTTNKKNNAWEVMMGKRALIFYIDIQISPVLVFIASASAILHDILSPP